jgi:hypothetical protein
MPQTVQLFLTDELDGRPGSSVIELVVEEPAFRDACIVPIRFPLPPP